MLKFVQTKPPRGRSWSGGSLDRSSSPRHRDRTSPFSSATVDRDMTGSESGSKVRSGSKERDIGRATRSPGREPPLAPPSWKGAAWFPWEEEDRNVSPFPVSEDERSVDMLPPAQPPHPLLPFPPKGPGDYHTVDGSRTRERTSWAERFSPYPGADPDLSFESTSCSTCTFSPHEEGGRSVSASPALPQDKATTGKTTVKTVSFSTQDEGERGAVGRGGGRTEKGRERQHDKWRPRFFSVGSRSPIATFRNKLSGSKSAHVCISTFLFRNGNVNMDILSLNELHCIYVLYCGYVCVVGCGYAWYMILTHLCSVICASPGRLFSLGPTTKVSVCIYTKILRWMSGTL